MSNLLLHSPADVTAKVITDVLALGTDPALGLSWPVFVTSEPSTPDNCVTITNTTPVSFGQVQIDGEELKHWGIQVRVRAVDDKTGWAKAYAIQQGLAERVYAATIVLDGASYLVHCYARFTGPIDLGKNVPSTKRSLFTVNATVAIRALP